MHSSKVLAQKWAVAIYLVLTARKGISSLQLSKALGVTQKTAWFMLARVREACRPGDFKLSGEVAIDETDIGGKQSNKHAHQKLKVGRGGVGLAAARPAGKSATDRQSRPQSTGGIRVNYLPMNTAAMRALTPATITTAYATAQSNMCTA